MFDKNEIQKTLSALGFANEHFDSYQPYIVDLVLILVLRDKRFSFNNTSFIVELKEKARKQSKSMNEHLRLESPTADSLRAPSLARCMCSSGFQWHPGKWHCSFLML